MQQMNTCTLYVTPVLFHYNYSLLNSISCCSAFSLTFCSLVTFQQWVGNPPLTAQMPPSFWDASGTHQSATVIQYLIVIMRRRRHRYLKSKIILRIIWLLKWFLLMFASWQRAHIYRIKEFVKVIKKIWWFPLLHLPQLNAAH